MRNKKAKQLKRVAEEKTVGQSARATRKLYRQMKKEYIRQQNEG